MAYDQSFFRNVRASLAATAPGRSFMQGIGESFGMHYERGVSQGFLGRKAPGGVFGGAQGFGRKGLTLAGRAAFPAFMALSAYSGYKQGGVFGAAKNVAIDAAMWGGIRAAFSMLTSAPVIAGGMFVGAGYGYYKLGEAARTHVRKLRNVEMGADLVDRYGTMSTMRQRSLAAIQNTHINGRMALGNEALLLSAPYRR